MHQSIISPPEASAQIYFSNSTLFISLVCKGGGTLPFVTVSISLEYYSMAIRSTVWPLSFYAGSVPAGHHAPVFLSTSCRKDLSTNAAFFCPKFLNGHA